MLKSHPRIYHSGRHLALTFIFIFLPFAFFILFSRFARIGAGKLLADIFVSLLRLAAAYGIAAILGWLFAVSFWRGRRAAVALPIFDVLQSFPAFTVLPLATFFWGATNFTVIFFLVLAVIWPIFFSIVSSLKLIRKDWEEAVVIAGLKGRDYLLHFLMPASLSGFITGSIIGLGEGWEAVVATEIIVGIRSGVGDFFSSFSASPVITAFGVFGLLLFIFSINKLVWLPLLEWSHREMSE